MSLSCSKGVKGSRPARNEREFLRYKAHIGKISKPAGTKWQWSEDDEQLQAIREIMQSYKEDKNARAPLGWRKLPPADGHKDKAEKKSESNGGKKKKRSQLSSSKSSGAKKKLKKV